MSNILLNRYELRGLIGRGGLGEVVLAKDRQLGRLVAIKRIVPPDSANQEVAAAAVNEARALAVLMHQNVVAVFDVSSYGRDVLIIMEYAMGRTLQEIGDSAPVTEEDFVSIASQSLRGIAAAHEEKLLHCDIKPSNIMVSVGRNGDLRVKVLDFGLSTVFDNLAIVDDPEKPREVLGSIFTMAPEQFERQPIDGRTDLYSLGCVLYFILAGKYPFTGDSVEDVIEAHLQNAVHNISLIRPDLDSRLSAWLMRMISVRPDHRPATAEEALQEMIVSGAALQ